MFVCVCVCVCLFVGPFIHSCEYVDGGCVARPNRDAVAADVIVVIVAENDPEAILSSGLMRLRFHRTTYLRMIVGSYGPLWMPCDDPDR